MGCSARRVRVREWQQDPSGVSGGLSGGVVLVRRRYRGPPGERFRVSEVLPARGWLHAARVGLARREEHCANHGLSAAEPVCLVVGSLGTVGL